jgi:hypothetical protein
MGTQGRDDPYKVTRHPRAYVWQYLSMPVNQQWGEEARSYAGPFLMTSRHGQDNHIIEVERLLLAESSFGSQRPT